MGKSRREGVAEVGVAECGMLVPTVWSQIWDSPWFADGIVLDDAPRWARLCIRLPGQPIDATISCHYKEEELPNVHNVLSIYDTESRGGPSASCRAEEGAVEVWTSSETAELGRE
jgi:hypothetical protein